MIASRLFGSMSSSTAMTTLPTFVWKLDASLRARQTSPSEGSLNWMKITGRIFESGSCIRTLTTDLTPHVLRRKCKNIGSYATILIVLDSLGVTWLMNDDQIGSRRCVIAVISTIGLSVRSLTKP